MPSLLETVARMPPPSTRVAVTVAPATGSFAAFVTVPTIAPDDILTVGASDPSARTTDSRNAVAAPDNTKLCRCFRNFINGIPLQKPTRSMQPNHNVTARPRSYRRAVAVYGRSGRSVDQSALKK